MISYDTNVLIYALETDSDIAVKARKVIAESESVGAVVSVIVKQEIYTGRVLMGESIDYAVEALESLTGTKWQDVNEKVVITAAKLTKAYGAKVMGYDAIILATAIVGKASKFYTNDKTLLDLNIPEIEICGL